MRKRITDEVWLGPSFQTTNPKLDKETKVKTKIGSRNLGITAPTPLYQILHPRLPTPEAVGNGGQGTVLFLVTQN